MTEARILLADEDQHSCLSLRESLEHLGYLVVGEARNGTNLIEMAQNIRPDLVLTDVKIPEVDGIEVARILHQNKIAPVILTTWQSNRNLVDQACKAGVLGYLLKPVQGSELMPIIEVVRTRWNEHVARYEELARLKDQIETRSVIERAKVLLMDTHGLREADAFRKIQRLAMNNRRTMREVAQAILLAQQIT